MASLLKDLSGRRSPRSEYANRERLAYLKSRPSPQDWRQLAVLKMLMGKETMHVGNIREAIRLLKEAESLAATTRAPQLIRAVRENLGIAYLRLGEVENCVAFPSADACVFPIAGQGIHRLTDGSTHAIDTYEKLLQMDPDDLSSRWFLNLAHMTLGQYPDGVPEPWLIPPESFASEVEFPRFPNVAASLGVDVLSQAGGGIMEDFDGDGDLDLMASSWDLEDPIRYFRNEGDGSFADATADLGLDGITGGIQTVQADYDNDGDVDVLVLRGGWLRTDGHHPNSLLRNNGDGHFSDVTWSSGIFSQHPTQTAAWADYDNDGWLDLYVVNESYREDRNPCQLFRNNGDGTFTDVAPSAGLDLVGYAKGVTWIDYDNDGLRDVYVSFLFEPNVLMRNEGMVDGAWRFRDVTASAGVAEPVRSFPTWAFDYDNDGWEDLFVSGYSTFAGDVAAEYLGRETTMTVYPRLYRNRGDGGFDDMTHVAGVRRVMYTMGCNFGDFDTDGWLDFIVGTGDPDFRGLMPNRAFRNNDGRGFQEITTAAGFGHLPKGHGVAFGDIDQDGDQDVYEVLGGAFISDEFHNALFLNPGFGHRWIVLDLVGSTSNRSALGARVRVHTQENGQPRQIHRTVSTGASFGASSIRLEVGLGNAGRIDSIVVAWPSGLESHAGSVQMDRAYAWAEGAPAPEPMAYKVIPFPSEGDGAGHHTHPFH